MRTTKPQISIRELDVLPTDRITCMFMNLAWVVYTYNRCKPPPPRLFITVSSNAVLLLWFILIVIVVPLPVWLRLRVRFVKDSLVTICCERAVRLCCFNCLCSFPVWCLGQDVEFDCIGPWWLPCHLLFSPAPGFSDSSIQELNVMTGLVVFIFSNVMTYLKKEMLVALFIGHLLYV